ncbi:DUF1330 domain-containing protein [Bradyrhizobium ontarionense]|uniref:DUF1330 domain-containing protein n=1 Tax=Bradyrhizobium ontarionense TaxID=2898149 RepID=A0ABY3RLA8_9BRAD|nr:DUF1330 domain-containing protein [Bradyrhizobium sp. A19]UFZ08285.1 DUF1330 domain-containing protein [Bradyrhizobium sp. A19]
MVACIISEVEIRDAEAAERYRTCAARSIAQYGGRYLVRGGLSAKSLIIVEFASMARLRQWYASPEYAEALGERRKALDRRLIFVEGAAPA